MNKELKDFIYGISEFNDCTFCKRFVFAKNCPLKNAYKSLDNEPSAESIVQNASLCKNFVFTSVSSLFTE